MCAKSPLLEADDSLAAEAAVAKLFERLARAVQFNHGADAGSDRAVREHVRNLVKPFWRRQGICARRNVVRRDLALSEPPFVCRIDRRDKTASRLENLGVAADRVRTIDKIEDRIDTARMRCAQGVNYVDGLGVVDFFGTEEASFLGVAADRG